jgi:hypothetical protein
MQDEPTLREVMAGLHALRREVQQLCLIITGNGGVGLTEQVRNLQAVAEETRARQRRRSALFFVVLGPFILKIAWDLYTGLKSILLAVSG